MPRSFLTGALLSLTLLSACSSGPPPGSKEAEVKRLGQKKKRKPARKLAGDELDELIKLSKAVVVGVVEEKLRERGALVYLVRVRELLVTRKGDPQHPLQEGSVIRVSPFLYSERKPSKKEIGGLLELSRYLFFLAPKDKAEEWFNLDDASEFALPEAQATLDVLREQKGKARGPSKEKLPPPAEAAPSK